MKVTAMSEGQQLRRVINSFQSLTVSLITWLSFIIPRFCSSRKVVAFELLNQT